MSLVQCHCLLAARSHFPAWVGSSTLIISGRRSSGWCSSRSFGLWPTRCLRCATAKDCSASSCGRNFGRHVRRHRGRLGGEFSRQHKPTALARRGVSRRRLWVGALGAWETHRARPGQAAGKTVSIANSEASILGGVAATIIGSRYLQTIGAVIFVSVVVST